LSAKGRKQKIDFKLQTQKYFLEPQEASKSINYALERAENKSGGGSGVHTRGRLLVNYAQAKFIISSGKTRWVAVNFARAANLSAAARARRARAQQQRAAHLFLSAPFSFCRALRKFTQKSR
jgi:hypothetical protein